MFSQYRNIIRTVFSSVTIHFKLKGTKVFDPIIMNEKFTFKKQKYDGRSKKRQWEERRTDKGEAFKTDMKKPKVDEVSVGQILEKIKRRKFCLLMGYSGLNYLGMQRNPGSKTIEEELFKALYKLEYINEGCYNQVQNMQFQRAARTDKGVSAARQIVSLKLPENIDLVKLNSELPEEIRVFGCKRVTKGFNSKSLCDSRTYTYMLPTVAFADSNDATSQADYRLSDEKFNEVNEVLKHYSGTKNYHNFTSKKKPNDPSAQRYMKYFVCEKPFISNNTEFAILKVQGQSFMMHQIRKMVGLVIAILRGLTTVDIMTKSLSTEKVAVPRAPGLGLVLDYVHYDRYNVRYGEDGNHEKLTWEEVEDQVMNFKEKFIFPTIVNTEVKEESMLVWIHEKLKRHSYDEVQNESDNEDAAGDDEEYSAQCVDNDKKDSENITNINKDMIDQNSVMLENKM